MKQININDFIYKNDLNIKDRMEVLGMEFIKVGKNYMIKNANGRIVSEKEKLQLENKELVLEDIKSNGCQGKTTKKISKNKKRIAEIEEQDANKSKTESFKKRHSR
jgi:uncharacterized protein (UPF0335 family)